MYEKEVQAISDEIFEIFKDLHQHPEPGYGEVRTADIIATYLKKCGLHVTTGIAITGVVGILDSGRTGKTLMIRADMDCLEMTELAEVSYKSKKNGLMHACGHDAHVTMLLGAAKILSRHKEAFRGKIKFVFQPAEEGTPHDMREKVRAAGYNGPGGAGFIVQEGILDDVDCCIVMHNQPSLPVGTIQVAKKNACASSDVYNITIVGKGGHGAMPQNAIDPTPAGAELIGALHMLPTREISAVETCVLSVGSVETPGSVWNAVPEKFCISGGFRTFNQDVRAHLAKRIKEIAEGICKINHCELIYNHEEGYMPCINNEEIARTIVEANKKTLGDDHCRLTEVPAMSSEDCGIYFTKVPGAFFWLGTRPDDMEEEDVKPLHNPYFHLDVKALSIGVNVHINNAIAILNKLNKE